MSKCGKYHTLVKNGFRYRDIISLPVGRKLTILHMKVQCYKCKECDYDQQDSICFTTGGRSLFIALPNSLSTCCSESL